jgi:alpha-1,3-rhamnosyl/mannosyltransferase
MRLGINGWRIDGQTGVPRYVANVVRHWTADVIDDRFERVTLYTPRPMDRAGLNLPPSIEQRLLGPDWPLLAWENARLGPCADDDVLFCPSNSRPLIARGRVVVTTHDAQPKSHPQFFPWSARLVHTPLYGWSARHADLVITDSQAARDDIVQYWGVAPSRMRVVYLAAAEHFRRIIDKTRVAEAHLRLLGSAEPFFLFVGKLSGRRSLPLLLSAFAEFRQRTRHPHRLVVVGQNIHKLNVAKMLHELRIAAHVCYPGYVADEDLNLLYNAAEALISPALYETMSLPVMEAQATGTPVIAMDLPALREITGGAALLLPRPGVPEMFAAMRRIAGEPPLRDALSERGLESSRRFSWRRCAEETLGVLEEAARATGRRRGNITRKQAA